MLFCFINPKIRKVIEVKRRLSKRCAGIGEKGTVDEIFRVSPETGKLMEHVGDNVYKDEDTGDVYAAKGNLANQTKQDVFRYPWTASSKYKLSKRC